MRSGTFIESRHALLCMDCEAIHDARDGVCPRCASEACYSIAKWIDRDGAVLEVPRRIPEIPDHVEAAEWMEAFV